jgi:lactoylglutathione lyase
MLRIKDPKITIPFYEQNFGFKLIHTYDFPQWKFRLFFLAIVPPEEESALPPMPGSKEAEEYLWKFKGVTLELTQNYGSETDESFKVCLIVSLSHFLAVSLSRCIR